MLADTWNHGESPERYPVDTGRLRRVAELAAKEAGWGRSLPKGSGLGIAAHYSFVSYVAAVVEVAVDAKGELTIPRVDIAIDCGATVNPDRVRAQMEGACVMGVSAATLGEITFKNGRAQQDNFNGYEVTRMPAAPREIRVHIVPGDYSKPMGGVGEPGVPPVLPALCNAIFAATGKLHPPAADSRSAESIAAQSRRAAIARRPGGDPRPIRVWMRSPKTSANRSYCPAHLRQTTVGEADLLTIALLLGYNFRTRNFI